MLLTKSSPPSGKDRRACHGQIHREEYSFTSSCGLIPSRTHDSCRWFTHTIALADVAARTDASLRGPPLSSRGASLLVSPGPSAETDAALVPQLATIIDILEGAFYGLDLLKLHSVTTKLLGRVDRLEEVREALGLHVLQAPKWVKLPAVCSRQAQTLTQPTPLCGEKKMYMKHPKSRQRVGVRDNQ